MSDQSNTQLVVLTSQSFAQYLGQVAFAPESENLSDFQRKVLIRVAEVTRVTGIIPQIGCVWEGDGILVYMDVREQYHIYLDMEKYESWEYDAERKNGVEYHLIYDVLRFEHLWEYIMKMIYPLPPED